MDFEDLASVSGKGGLFKVVSPTRSGVILESLDEEKKKMVAGMRTKVSVLSDISIYTTDEEGSVPLKDVMKRIHEEFKGDTGLTGSSSPEELKSFLKDVLPDYDDNRVYVSDIKKLVNWYNLIASIHPELMEEKSEEDSGTIEDAQVIEETQATTDETEKEESEEVKTKEPGESKEP